MFYDYIRRPSWDGCPLCLYSFIILKHNNHNLFDIRMCICDKWYFYVRTCVHKYVVVLMIHRINSLDDINHLSTIPGWEMLPRRNLLLWPGTEPRKPHSDLQFNKQLFGMDSERRYVRGLTNSAYLLDTVEFLHHVYLYYGHSQVKANKKIPDLFPS